MMDCVFATRRVNAVARLLYGQYTKVAPVFKQKIKMLAFCKQGAVDPDAIEIGSVI